MQIVIDIPDRIYYGAKNGITVNGSDASQILIDAVKSSTPYVTESFTWNYDNETCKYCGNNPKNGGSGVCHCTLATYKIT